ncbi:MAG: cadherin repeat domain-containing protein [Thiothrix sp.]
MLTYSISGGDDKDLFQISSAGALSFIHAPDYENPQDTGQNNVYEIQVRVSDGSLFDTQILNIQILDVVENSAPRIISDGGK